MKQVNKAVGRGMRWARSVARQGLLVVVLAAVVPLVGGPEALAVEHDQGVGEWPVSFEIINKNESATKEWCSGDKEKYTVRGSLVGPPGTRSGQVDAVTLYVPGSGDASMWHFNFTKVRGVDHVTEMARLGHASLSLHPLGYGVSDSVDGFAVCFGAYADHVAQVIDQLRNGSYGIAGHSDSAPKFPRVALAGHSGGGIIAELTQVSFAAADALIVAGWTDYAIGGAVNEDLDPPLPFPYGVLVRRTQQCVNEPEQQKWGDRGPEGWAYTFTESELPMLAHDIHGDVMTAIIERYERDPCGWGNDIFQAAAANIALAPLVEVPVLVGSGEHDPVAPPALVLLQSARYKLADSFEIKGAGHKIMLEGSAKYSPAWKYPDRWGKEFRELLHDWLDRNF